MRDVSAAFGGPCVTRGGAELGGAARGWAAPPHTFWGQVWGLFTRLIRVLNYSGFDWIVFCLGNPFEYAGVLYEW